MIPALIMNVLILPIKLIINAVRALIYQARGAIDTTGIYKER